MVQYLVITTVLIPISAQIVKSGVKSICQSWIKELVAKDSLNMYVDIENILDTHQIVNA